MKRAKGQFCNGGLRIEGGLRKGSSPCRDGFASPPPIGLAQALFGTSSDEAQENDCAHFWIAEQARTIVAIVFLNSPFFPTHHQDSETNVLRTLGLGHGHGHGKGHGQIEIEQITGRTGVMVQGLSGMVMIGTN